MSIESRQMLSHYRLLEKIGEGGMGVVWKAEDTVLNRQVAIKVLLADVSRDDARRQLFLQEAQLAGSISDGRIVQIHEFGREAGLDFIVMEYVDGKPLTKLIHGRPLPPEKVAEFGMEAASALSRAHRKGLIHRDLKPANIMVTPEGDVKVLDFGLAVLFDRGETTVLPDEAPRTVDGQESTSKGTLTGTLSYMSPEQARCEKLDSRTDIFSLGVILYEMATGQRPFTGATPVQILQEIQTSRPAPPHQRVRKLPLELDRIIQKTLARRRSNRYQSMDDLAVDLKRLGRELDSGSSPSHEDLARTVASKTRKGQLLSAAVGLLAIVALVVALNLGRGKESPLPIDSTNRIKSLAVLPLDNLSGDSEQDYFADGMTKALINDLAKIGALRVISRTSVMQYKGVTKPLPEIARELGVDAVLEGSVLREGHRVRITTQLIHAATDRHLWAERYEGDLRQVLALQSKVARAVADEIQIELTPAEQDRLSGSRLVPPAAYEAYLRGNHRFNRATKEGFQAAIDYYQEAIAIDPGYALAYARMSDAYFRLDNGRFFPALAQALEAATDALMIDDTCGEAYVSRGWVRLYSWDWTGAEEDFKRALRFTPGNPFAHLGLSRLLSGMGHHEEAVAEAKLARDIDPISEGVWYRLAVALYFARRYDEAIEIYHEMAELFPDYVEVKKHLGETLIETGRIEEAIKEAEKAVLLSERSIHALEHLGRAYARAGKKAKALEVLVELESAMKAVLDRSPNTRGAASWEGDNRFSIAKLHASLGDNERALELLREAYAKRASTMNKLRVDPPFDGMRDDPRFQELVRGMNFPD